MKIVVVGSGNIKSVCNSASYLINNNILIDMPNGCCKAISRLGYNRKEIKYLLLTHFHGDHYFDIPFYLLARTHSHNTDKDIFIATRKDGIKKIKALTKLAFSNNLDKIYAHTKINYITSIKFNIEGLEVEKVLVKHGDLKYAYGYVLNKNETYVGFTGDTSFCKNVEYLASKCSYLFIDCSNLVGNEKHMGIDNVEYLSSKYKNCKFITTHMDDEVRTELIKKNISNVIVPNDGDIIEINEI